MADPIEIPAIGGGSQGGNMEGVKARPMELGWSAPWESNAPYANQLYSRMMDEYRGTSGNLSDYATEMGRLGRGVEGRERPMGVVEDMYGGVGDRMESYLQDLQRQAQGDPNSYAQQQLKYGGQQALAQVQSVGNAMRQGNFGARQRMIGAQQGTMQSQLGQQSRLLGAQEQQAAAQMYSQLLGQYAKQQADLNAAKAEGRLSGNQMDEAMRRFYMGEGLGAQLDAMKLEADKQRAELGIGAKDSEFRNRQISDIGQGAATGVKILSDAYGNRGDK